MHGLQPLKISYEDDLERNPESTIRRALSWIGVLPPQRPTVQPQLPRQADALSDAWVASYHRDVSSSAGAPSDPR
jgi:LPS sulfotransferase NodH